MIFAIQHHQHLHVKSTQILNDNQPKVDNFSTDNSTQAQTKMGLRGLGSPTGTASNHNKSYKRSKPTSTARDEEKTNSISKISGTPPASNTSKRSNNGSNGTDPSKSHSAQIESLLEDHERYEDAFPISETQEIDITGHPLNGKSSCKTDSASPVKSDQRKSNHSSGAAKKSSGNKDSRKRESRKKGEETKVARRGAKLDPAPRKTNGLMFVNERVDRYPLPGTSKPPMNGRLFGCLFLFGRTGQQKPETKGIKDRRGGEKRSHRKKKNVKRTQRKRTSYHKDGKRRHSHGNYKLNGQSGASRQAPLKKDQRKSRSTEHKALERNGSSGKIKRIDTKRPAENRYSHKRSDEKRSTNKRSSGRRTSTKRSHEKRSVISDRAEETLYRVEVAGKKKDSPAVVFKVCARNKK